MSFQVREATYAVGDKSFAIWVLENPATGDRAEIYPGLGFNCFRWCCGGRELLYDDGSLFTTGRPTRAGIPILFPFPNRIAGAAYTWEGKSYRLPATDANGQNAIHGFACRKPWRIVESGADTNQAWITGEFWAKQDAPEILASWPADHRIRVRITLLEKGLTLQADIDNPDGQSLPFGLGYHPYFRLAAFSPTAPEAVPVAVPATTFWELKDNLPTGNRRPVDARRDLNVRRPIGELILDDVLTGLPVPACDTPQSCGRIGDLQVKASPSFREMVVFTPPHRQAFCLEPYTCTTDAINLAARGVDGGLLVLAPGQHWRGVVELLLD